MDNVDILDILPEDVLIQLILPSLQVNELSRWSQTSKRMLLLCNKESIWEVLANRKFSHVSPLLFQTWKEMLRDLWGYRIVDIDRSKGKQVELKNSVNGERVRISKSITLGQFRRSLLDLPSFLISRRCKKSNDPIVLPLAITTPSKLSLFPHAYACAIITLDWKGSIQFMVEFPIEGDGSISVVLKNLIIPTHVSVTHCDPNTLLSRFFLSSFTDACAMDLNDSSLREVFLFSQDSLYDTIGYIKLRLR